MTYSDAMKDMRQVIRSLTKEGKDINEVLDMPFHFLIGILGEKAENIKIIEGEDDTEKILDRM